AADDGPHVLGPTPAGAQRGAGRVVLTGGDELDHPVVELPGLVGSLQALRGRNRDDRHWWSSFSREPLLMRPLPTGGERCTPASGPACQRKATGLRRLTRELSAGRRPRRWPPLGSEGGRRRPHTWSALPNALQHVAVIRRVQTYGSTLA